MKINLHRHYFKQIVAFHLNLKFPPGKQQYQSGLGIALQTD